MVQWINVLLNNSFVNLTRLTLLYRNSRAVALAEPGLTADWLADKMRANFKFLKFVVNRIFELFAAFNTIRAI